MNGSRTVYIFRATVEWWKIILEGGGGNCWLNNHSSAGATLIILWEVSLVTPIVKLSIKSPRGRSLYNFCMSKQCLLMLSENNKAKYLFASLLDHGALFPVFCSNFQFKSIWFIGSFHLYQVNSKKRPAITTSASYGLGSCPFLELLLFLFLAGLMLHVIQTK